MTPTSSEPRRIGARFSLRSALVATAVCAAIFAGIRQYIFITTPRVAILCEKPGAKLYFRDQFQGMVPVTYTESRARLLVPDYDQVVRKWHRGFPSKERERDLRSILTDQVASGGRGFWLLHEADDEHSYHYRETPWGLALGLTSVGGDRRGLHMDLHRRSAESIEFVESWKLSDKPVLPGTRCQASVLLGATASADSIGKQWRVQIHYDLFEPIDYAATQPRRKRIPDPEAVEFQNSDSGTHLVWFDAPTEPAQYAVSLWLYAIPGDARNNHPAADYEMITVATPGKPD